jgi:hypothetical protein
MQITFFFPNKSIGGVSILFANLANFISVNYNYIEVFIIDYKGGCLWKNIKSDLVKKIPFNDGVECCPNEDSFLVMQSIVPNAMRPELIISQKQKILFWHLHPYNYQISNLFKINFADKIINKFRVIEKNRIKKFIKIIDVHNGIIFMDGSNFDKTIKTYDLKIKENYVPITNFKTSLDHSKNNLKITHEINLSYVGRFTDFKYYPLIKLLKTLDKLVLEKIIIPKINFFIIGEGDFKNNLVKEIKKLNFKVSLIGEVDYSELSSIFIYHNININFSMGTSALDSACLGIPSVVLDYSYVEINGYPNYNWIYNEKDYSLTEELNSTHLSKEFNFSLSSLIKETQCSYAEISKKTEDYYNKNYSINIISDLLIKSLNNSSLEFNYISSFLKKSILRKIYEKLKYK